MFRATPASMRRQTLFLDLTALDLSAVSGGDDVNVFGENQELARYYQWLDDEPMRLQSLGISSAAPLVAPSASTAGPVNYESWERMMEQRVEDAYFYRLDNY